MFSSALSRKDDTFESVGNFLYSFVYSFAPKKVNFEDRPCDNDLSVRSLLFVGDFLVFG